jgi:hypothetical protein
LGEYTPLDAVDSMRATLCDVNWRRIIIATAIAPLIITIANCQTTAAGRKYAFSAEDDQVPHPAKLPYGVFTILKSDASSVQDEDMPQKEMFSAEKLQSRSARADLYIVMAAGSLRGANVSEFWLVRYNLQTKQAVILWKGAEHDLRLRFRPGHLYPDIHTAKMSAVHLWESDFTFRDGKYVLSHRHDEELR